MFNCTCADCGKDFRTFDPSWWCDECRKKRFEKCQDKKPKTNADRIRAMSDEELAENFCNKRITKEMWLKWLKQPAEGE